MSEDTKYYCDRCDKEVHFYDSVSIMVIASEGIRNLPSRLRGFYERESDYYGFKYVDTQGHLICKECLGEEWQASCNLEPYHSFSLKKRGIGVLEKLRLIRPAIMK